MMTLSRRLPSVLLRLALPVALILPAACGPMSMAEAERQCFERARLAQ